MKEIDVTVEQLRGMIGSPVCYQGITCWVIEVLEDGPILVLADGEFNTDIQDDQYGNPHRQVSRTYTVQVLTDNGDDLHPEFLELDLDGCL